jgi:hypothetical protein
VLSDLLALVFSVSLARPAVDCDAEVFYPAAKAEVPVFVGWFEPNDADPALEHTRFGISGLVRDFGNHQRTHEQGIRFEAYRGKTMEAVAAQIGGYGFNRCS